MAFKFELGSTATISLNRKVGQITARSAYFKDTHPNLYELHYVNGTGDAVYEWFHEGDLEG